MSDGQKPHWCALSNSSFPFYKWDTEPGHPVEYPREDTITCVMTPLFSYFGARPVRIHIPSSKAAFKPLKKMTLSPGRGGATKIREGYPVPGV